MVQRVSAEGDTSDGRIHIRRKYGVEKSMIESPRKRDFGKASSGIAMSNSNIPEARISARRPLIEAGASRSLHPSSRSVKRGESENQSQSESASPARIAVQGDHDTPRHEQ